MLFSVGNAITLLIVLLFFLVYHRLTANNRSLEKVKKLADRLQEELSGYVEARAEELKHYGIDLDVQQKAAKIALEKLQSAQAVISEKSETVSKVADRFKEYDEALSRLMDMTAKVDENLARIQEEAVFAEGVNRKLDLSKKQLSALERELPLLREDFSREAKQSLDAFRDGLLDEIGGSLSAARSELAAARDESLRALEAAKTAGALVEAELGKILAAAADRAEDLEDRAFAALKAASEDRIRSVESAFAEKLQAATVAAESQLAELQASVSERIRAAAEESAERLSSLDRAMRELESGWKEESGAMLEDMRSRLAEADSIFALKGAEIASAIASAREKAETDKASLAEAARLASEELAATREEAKSILSELGEALEATKTRIQEDFAAFGQEFEDRRTRFEADFASETKSLATSLGALGKAVEALKASAYEGAKAKLEGFEDQLLDELREKKAESFKKLDSWLSDMERTLSGISAQASARRQAEEEKGIQEARAHMLKVRDELNAQLDRMSRDVEAFERSIAERVEEAEKRVAVAAEAFHVERVADRPEAESEAGNPSSS
ncbi:MAG TPA: hypothetical protein VIO60_03575 [Rectinemataceae bacterium]